jgi:hypothetical protein
MTSEVGSAVATLLPPQKWELQPWCTYHVEDYAGWRNDNVSVSTPITREEFERRAAQSSTRPKHPVIPDGARTVPTVVTTLRELPVGAIFVCQDAWGDGTTLEVKLSNHGFNVADTDSCYTGSTHSGRGGPMLADVNVQEIGMSPEVAFVIRVAAGMSVAEARNCQ